MLGMACNYSPKQHSLIHPEQLTWCKRETCDPLLKEQLFCYLQREIGVFVIARWTDKVYGSFVDILNLGRSLASFTREKAQEFKRRVNSPISAAHTRRFLEQADRDYYSRQANVNMELHENQERTGPRRTHVGFGG